MKFWEITILLNLLTFKVKQNIYKYKTDFLFKIIIFFIYIFFLIKKMYKYKCNDINKY